VNVEVKAILPPMVSELRRLGFCAFGCVAFFWVATLGAEHKKAKRFIPTRVGNILPEQVSRACFGD